MLCTPASAAGASTTTGRVADTQSKEVPGCQAGVRFARLQVAETAGEVWRPGPR